MSAGGSVELIGNRYLTVAGETDSAAHPDWRERYLRNEARWLSHRHRAHERRFRPEPLWYTPQVPDPNVYMIRGSGRETVVGHPETLNRLATAITLLRIPRR